MAGPIYLATGSNVVASNSPTFTASAGTATGSSTANIANGEPAKQWVSGAAFTTSPQTFEADFGGSTAATFCAIFNHNIPADATVKIQYYDGTWNDAATFTLRGDPTSPHVYVTFGSASGTKWRLHLTTGASTSVVPTVGEWVLGTSTQLTRAPLAPHDIQAIPNVIRNQTAAGSPRTHKVANVRRRFPFAWRGLTGAEVLELSVLWLNGPHSGTPFTIVPFPDESGQQSVVSSSNTDAEVYFVEGDVGNFVYQYRADDVYDVALTMTELPINITLAAS